MGGRLSLLVAGHLGATVGAAASFHGGGLAVEGDPDSPHGLAPQVRATVYVAGAENDASFDAAQKDRLDDAYRAAGLPFEPALSGALPVDLTGPAAA